MITQEELKRILRYDRDTGDFFWINYRPGIRSDKKAGNIQSNGYTYIRINGRLYLAHRLAWLYENGFMPPEVDHDKGKSNRFVNLRIASHSQNCANKSVSYNSITGYKGVTLNNGRGKRYKVGIMVDKRQIHLGYFDSIEEAKTVYLTASQKYFGEFARG